MMLRAWRDRLLGDPARRAAIARTRIGARIADAHAARLFGVMTGLAGSRMLAAAVELELFERLAAGAAASDDLARAAALPPAGIRALADAMCACGLWRRVGDGLALTLDGLVVATDPAIRAMIAHDELLAADFADPVTMLRRPGTGALAAYWPYRGGGDAAGFSAVMTASHGFAGGLLANAVDFGRFGVVMDVGGGEGAFVADLAARWPRLRLMLVDLPEVAALAAGRLAADPRIAVHPRRSGEPLPAGADAATLVRVLHDLDDDAALALLRAVAAALPAGGTVIVAEPMRRRGRDPVAAYFSAYFVAMGSGRLRSRREVRALLAAAGFRPRRPTTGRLLLAVETAVKHR